MNRRRETRPTPRDIRGVAAVEGEVGPDVLLMKCPCCEDLTAVLCHKCGRLLVVDGPAHWQIFYGADVPVHCPEGCIKMTVAMVPGTRYRG